ncbi:MAG: phosphonoacetaldehyde reductase [Christensenellaceae bacterium]|nr:phosphonoacetaldehyde reductase [Christensenellaceae bacterium]
MAQKTLRGRGKLAKIRELMDKLNITRPLLVCDGFMAPVFAEKTGMDVPQFSAFHPNPDFADCAAGAALYREKDCDGLISLGGGSAMDTAKAIKALLLAGNDDKALRCELPEDVSLPHIAIPTSAGTGAEATQFAVVYVSQQKVSLSHPALLPDGVLHDGSLLDTLPDYHRKSCAMDALCQGIESYWAKGATEDSRVHAYLAILGVLDNLRAYLAGDPHAQDEMLEAAYRSGRAIQVSRTTAAHAMSYQLTKKLGYAHGHACMLTLPYLWEHLAAREDALPIVMEIADRMRMGNEAMVPRLLKGMMIDLEMEPKGVPDAATLDELADSVNPERLGNHPETLTREELRRIYARALSPVSGMERQMCLDLWRYYGQ